MRKKEKLAHDVYAALYDQWGLSIVQNINRSKQPHTEAVLNLLNRYHLADPATTQVGIFTDPALQSLYTQLVAQGTVSLSEAPKVEALIWER